MQQYFAKLKKYIHHIMKMIPVMVVRFVLTHQKDGEIYGFKIIPKQSRYLYFCKIQSRKKDPIDRL